MDPKGDRLRKIQSGQLKLPDSILKSTSIGLTTDKPRGGGGCLEGGPRPRPTNLEDGVGPAPLNRTPIIIHGNNNMTLSAAEIPLPAPSPDKPLPSHADIPLPDAGDIPLPTTDMGNIPLPSEPLMVPLKHDDIPLPSNDSIPLPAEKPQRRIKVSLSHLEPRGDELQCRSCVMMFSKQIEYDIHLQSDAHQQAIKSELPDSIGTGASLLNKRPEKSPSHDGKSGHVSFSFIKSHLPRITNTQPFIQRREEKRASPVEIKLLKPETETEKPTIPRSDVVDGQNDVVDNGKKNDIENGTDIEKGTSEKTGLPIPENRLLMSDFVKVQSKDDSGRVLDWPKEMIQYTVSEPKLMFSCNPLSFDFSQLFGIKKEPKVEPNGQNDSVKDMVIGDTEHDDGEKIVDDSQKAETDDKKKSRKKKKKRKHKKHKANKEVKEGDEATEPGTVKPEEEASSSKKKKKKHKRKHEDKEGDTTKESVELNSENPDEMDKEKKSKKKKKKSKQSDLEGDKMEEDDDKKHKKKKKKKSKKKKKKHHGESDKEEKTDELEKDKEKVETADSGKESDAEKKEKDGKKKKKKRKKHKRKEGDDIESSDSETEKPVVEPIITEPVLNVAAVSSNIAALKKRKFPEGDSDGESDKIVARLQALSRTKIVPKQTHANNLALQKRIKKEPADIVEKKTPSERKRVTSESSVNDTPVKKVKVTPVTSGIKDNIPISLMQLPNVKVEKEESWSKIETQTNDNVKSKWDTSDSDMDNALNDTVKKEKVLKKRSNTKTVLAGNKPSVLKDLKSPGNRSVSKIDTETKKLVTQSSSQRSNKSNVSASSAKLLNSVGEKNPRKSRKMSESPASSHSRSRTRSRGRRRSYSASESSSRSRSRSYSSSSDYTDDSRHSRRHRRSRRSSSRSYSRSSSRSRSRSYRRRRGRSSSTDYSRSRSYSTSRSRSRSRRRNKRSYSRSRSRSYSSSSSDYRSRSRNRSSRKRTRKTRRRRKRVSRARSLSKSPVHKSVTKKKEEKEVKEKVKEEKEKVDPSDIPLPDLSGKKDDERTEEKLKKLKKTRRGDVGETVAKLVESLPADIPLPFSEGVTKTVSSDSLPSGPPSEALKENDSGFIGPKMPAPPPPPPMGRGFPPNHGPPGPPRPGWGGQWDHWDPHGPWDAPGPWDGPGPGPRPPFRGMRPPYDPRMYGPYDPRRRGPHPFMNRPRGPHPYMGPRYPGPNGPHGPHPDYHEGYGYDYSGEYDHNNTEENPAKNTSSTPPPLPKEPPKESSPKPPLPKKKVKEQEPEQNPDIVIPPEQAEQYKHLQKQAQKHARRQLRRQAKKDLGEPDEDSTSSESEPEEQAEPEIVEEVPEEEETQTAQLVAIPQQVVLQPQPTGSPSGAYIIVSGGQQYIVQKPHIVQAQSHLQAGQPVMVSQGAILATAHAAASGAQPAHIVQQVPALSGHPMIAAPTHITAGGVPVHMASAASIQHMQQVQQLQQIHQIQQIQQIQQAQAIQAHNQAVAAAHAAQHGSIMIGGRVLVPTIVRPGI